MTSVHADSNENHDSLSPRRVDSRTNTEKRIPNPRNAKPFETKSASTYPPNGYLAPSSYGLGEGFHESVKKIPKGTKVRPDNNKRFRPHVIFLDNLATIMINLASIGISTLGFHGPDSRP